MKMILSTIVGSRLHGTHDEDSDYDYRGVFIAPLIEILSPFREPKEAHWIEGKEADDTAYELRKFCKMAAQGNPSVLEVLVGEEYQTLTEEGKKLKELLPAFLSQKCYFAFCGYSNNQEKKFRDPATSNGKGKDVLKPNRKYKYACAHVRTLYQLRHLLKEKELIGKYPEAIARELKEIKDGLWMDRDIMGRIFQLEEECKKYFNNTWLPKEADIPKIEEFIVGCYTNL